MGDQQQIDKPWRTWYRRRSGDDGRRASGIGYTEVSWHLIVRVENVMHDDGDVRGSWLTACGRTVWPQLHNATQQRSDTMPAKPNICSICARKEAQHGT